MTSRRNSESPRRFHVEQVDSSGAQPDKSRPILEDMSDEMIAVLVGLAFSLLLTAALLLYLWTNG